MLRYFSHIPRHALRRLLVAATAASLIAVGLPTGPLVQASQDDLVKVRFTVLDQFGQPQSPATVMACPIEGGVVNCGHLVAGATNTSGVARLALDEHTSYSINAFVQNPSPPWACPGFVFQGNMFYFSDGAPMVAYPEKIPEKTTFVIHRPSAAECVPVRVVDDAGVVLTTANMFVCPLAADGTPCAAASFPTRLPDGTLQLSVDPAVTYRLTPFITNSGWPCPGFVAANGDTFHFGPAVDVAGSVLLAGSTTLVIHHPSAAEC